jgi:hypothetical protein
MIWLSLLSSVVKTGAEVFQNRQESKRLESVAEKTYMAKMATGEIDYQKAVMDNNNNGWKDELVLIMVCLPIVILAWSIFSGDPDAKQKLDMFFEYFNNFPEFYKWLVLGIFGSIYGLKPGMDLIKKKIMSEDVYKMFSSQYSKKVSLLSQQTGERYGKKKSTRNTKASKDKKKKTRSSF